MQAGNVKWEAFAQSPGGLATIAMGIGRLGECGEPLSFSQDKEGDDIKVSINCNAPDNDSSVILRFKQVGPNLFVHKVDVAG